jgi:para-nitrobenzyl esterase
MRAGAALLFIAMLITAPAAARTLDGKPVKVVAPAGTVEGRARDSVDRFAGIPYARAPVGDLRWRAPMPVPHWNGVRQAAAFGNDCPQVRFPGDLTPSYQAMSEDCLFLNLWRPAGARKLPVMVWIHGGGFVAGSSASPVLDGAALARRGVLVVSFNYRLGRFGFFAHPALSAEAGGKAPVNYAFLDMIAALKWVRANAAAFGGDPGKVTIFGESAGGAAVNFLMASPEAQGLFGKAIVESGANRSGYARTGEDRPYRVSAEKNGVAFAKAAGLPDNAGAAQLRALPTDKVLGQLSMVDPQADRFAGPTVDGRIVVADPIDRFAAGDVPAIPYLIGSNGGELSQESFAPLMIQAIEKYSPPEALALLRKTWGDPLPAALIDPYFFGEAARGYARMMAARGVPAWHYRFDYVADADRAKRAHANHASEIAFVFGNLPSTATDADRAVAKAMGDYWVNFARTGDPNGAGLVRWPRVGSGDPLLMVAPAGFAGARDDDPRLDSIEKALALQPR